MIRFGPAWMEHYAYSQHRQASTQFSSHGGASARDHNRRSQRGLDLNLARASPTSHHQGVAVF